MNYSQPYFNSKNYRNWINLAVIVLIIVVGSGILTQILRYFYWKSHYIMPNGQLVVFDQTPQNSSVEPMTSQFTSQLDEEPVDNGSDLSFSQPIAIVSMMKKPKNIETWLAKHRELGISRFYIRLEDTPELEEMLGEQMDVVLTVGKSTGKNEYLDIQTRQNKMMDGALKAAKADGQYWLIHIDSDEILQGDLAEIRELPNTVRTFWFQNEEAKYANIPRSEDNCFIASKFINCAEHPDKCVSYGNGKGGGRVADDVSADGPHRFKSSIPEANAGQPKLSRVIVQHYESCDFDMYKQKFQNLAVQDTPNNIPFSYYTDSIEAAKLPGDEALKRVFMQYRVVSKPN